MTIYDPIFSSAQMAAAAGMSHANFRALLSRADRWSIMGAAKPADALGKGHAFTIYDALGYALARALMDHGVAPKKAFDLGMMDYAHASGEAGRDPGGIFPAETHGITLYVYSLGASHGRCVGTKKTSPIDLLIPPMHNRAGAAIVIDINGLRDRVFRALGLDSRDYE